MSQELTGASLPRQSAPNNSGAVVQVGGNNSAPITVVRRPKLPTFRVSNVDRAAAMEPLWAHTPTPQRAADLLAGSGLAVIVGDQGTGRRISAVRAAQTHLSTRFDSPQLLDIAADWDDGESLEAEVLPVFRAGCGFLLDATSRPLSAAHAHKLTAWAESLFEAGSCLVITANQRDWLGDNRFEVSAVRPDAVQVARNHLAERLSSPVHAQWLRPDPAQASSRGFLRAPGTHDATNGVFSGLITRGVSPANAVAIAERLHRVAPQRLATAVERSQDKNSAETQQQGLNELKAIQEEVLLWNDFLEDKLVEIGTRGPDRLMLLAAAYLEGAPLELCIKAATEFGLREDSTARRYREGRSPRRRMLDVGVDITPEDTAAFSSRPGLAPAAIRMDWHHWTTEREETKEWVKRITAPGQVAEAWTSQVGQRLLELSLTAVEGPFFPILDSWVTTTTAGAQRIQIIAQLLSEATQRDELAREAHKKLLDWSSNKSAPHREVVARVCSGVYGHRWPHRALVRLRHVLNYDDGATQIAENALVEHAVGSEVGFNRVIDTLDTWLEDYPTHPAGPRAFLTLTDPTHPTNILARLINLAQTSPKIRDFLITGWQRTLERPEVRDRAYQVLLAWAQAIHEKNLDQVFAFGILTDVRNAHTPVDALSRFLYGSPDQEDPALINARFALANLRVCGHTGCSKPDCPLVKSQGATANGGIAANASDPEP
ncbi:hypothetical protein HW130_01855 [Streptomyces sp. PKU-EA00015]|uniref:hypothetical protein n=1 Tax=Streptomyces sp. PKU-EA00015 TaxID=2748326 RepID=UPI0015A19A2B|nr:hypothetical protein [Streptomyces sp. PKU-EA00015]NWF25015.1 hypothetical protein [Streptomyces sp. PKU-EA00015]